MLRALRLSRFISFPSPTRVPGRARLAQTHLAGSCGPCIPRCRGDGRVRGTRPACGCPHAAPRSPPWPAVPRGAPNGSRKGQGGLLSACGFLLPGGFGWSRVSPETFANGRRETIAMRRCFLPFKVFTCAAQRSDATAD